VAIKSLQVLFLGVIPKYDKGFMTFMVDQGRSLELPFLSFLVRADEGNILIDVGLHPEDVEAAIGQKVTLPPEHHLPRQLQNVGLSMNDINMVVLTHLHPDHIGWLNFLPQAKVYAQKEEYRYTMYPYTVSPAPFTPVVDCPQRYKFRDIKWNLIDGDQIIIPGLSVILTSGHTAGHQAVMVDLPESGPILIAGDAAFLQESLDEELIPASFFDARQSLLSIKRMKLWAQIRKGRIFPGHDYAYWQQRMKKPPEAYT
jgi:N-acyl homoserine lactone hydrolase